MKKAPNIILCVMDDHQFDALGVCGHPVADTPFLDSLAHRGVRFAEARLPGGSCGAICMPSRAMLHTGRPMFELEGNGGRMPPEHATLGERLRAVGYATAHTGKWHNDRASLHRSFETADEWFLGGMSDPWNTPLFHHDPSGAYETTLPAIHDRKHDNTVEWRPGDHVHAGRHCTDIFCDRAARFVAERDPERPFFVSLALMAPHDPRTAPPAFHAKFPPEDMPLPENFLEEPRRDTGALKGRDDTLAAMPRDPEDIRRHIADYHAMIHHLDAGLGRVMAAVEASGEADNTIFVFVGDHGLQLGRLGIMGKQCGYEHSFRVPLIAAGPGIPAGAVREDEVMHFDLYTTLLRRARAEAASDWSRDLAWESADRATDPDLPAERRYHLYGKTIRAYREDRFKLIEYAMPGYRASELFDLEADPLEMHDLSEDPAHAATLRSLRETLVRLSHRTGDRRTVYGEAFWEAFEAAERS